MAKHARGDVLNEFFTLLIAVGLELSKWYKQLSHHDTTMIIPIQSNSPSRVDRSSRLHGPKNIKHFQLVDDPIDNPHKARCQRTRHAIRRKKWRWRDEGKPPIWFNEQIQQQSACYIDLLQSAQWLALGL